ncbi:hypothetical protein E8E14_015000 [Neopestalotiopsis sp. 37M]|nr:hypothetical protein E8E14_015000 [Neopestalotiopsis sp. 37M]
MSQPERLPGGDLGSREEQTESTSTHLQANSSNSVEMENLSPKAQDQSGASTAPGATTSSVVADSTARDPQSAQTAAPDNSEDIGTSSQDAENTEHPSAKALGKAPATATEAQDTDAIGPADSSAEQSTPGELNVDILIIIPSTGNRHPFKINEKYLKKRNVNVTGVTEDGKMDPFSITVYTLKELILREWRTEWETPPREPTSIRLIKLGKMLDDKSTLAHYNFSPSVTSIIHMTVKPQEIVDEEEANKRLKEPSSRSGRSGCCVIL